jgi:peptidoglycan/xylan/chitin deacetylase (PgdA/CDA1 family)
MRQLILFPLLVSILLTGCGEETVSAPGTVSPANLEPALALTPFQPGPNTRLPRPSPTFSLTPPEPPSSTPDILPTSAEVVASDLDVPEPNSLNVPVLLYHHVSISPYNSSYYVTPGNFEVQMRLLYSEGYTTISTEMLVQAIKYGNQLPEKSIIITFDDGNLDVFTSAFPIMQRYNFTGVAYIVYHYLGAPGYMDRDQVKTLAKNGWEIGSHGLNHLDLLDHGAEQRSEIISSRQLLEKELGVPVLTFAYPYGRLNDGAMKHVREAGYIAAFGVRNHQKLDIKYLFNLQRLEVKGYFDIYKFSSMLSQPEDFIQLSVDPTSTLDGFSTPIPTYTEYPTNTTQP